jgi:DinB superfamily
MTSPPGTSSLTVDDVRARLSETPAILTGLCGGWSDELWSVNEGAGTWSTREVLCHLIHCEDDNWIPRVRQILDGGGQEPFRPFDRVQGFEKYDHEPPARLLDLFAERRTENLRTLDGWTIGASALAEPGIHPEFGRVTLEQLLATWVTHDFGHLVQIARIAAKHYGQWAGPWRAYMSVFPEAAIRAAAAAERP